MLGITVNKLHISVETNGGDFSCTIPLASGLNIIRAENSSGKSTCVNAIAYGLGLEPILGPIRKRPFPKSLYEEIFDTKKNQNPFFVSRSSVSLEIKNSSGEVATLTRDVAGDDCKISVESNAEKTDYFLGASGKVGSTISERGFHHWLATFLGWSLPKVVTYEGKETPLYLECIFPLFFVEQKRGWSEIQANIPTHYGIKNVRRVAAEFCLGIDSFILEKKVAECNNCIGESETEWEKIQESGEATAEFNEVEFTGIPPIEKYSDSSEMDFVYFEGDARISISEQQRSLERLIEKLSQEGNGTAPNNEKLHMQNAVVRKFRRELARAEDSVEVTMLAIADVDNKLVTLKHDLDQYQQLRRLRNVGASMDLDLDTKTCPICESDLYDTLGNRTVKRQPMSLEENIQFLMNQVDFFESIRDKNVSQLENYESRVRLLRRKVESESVQLNEIRADLDDINGSSKALIRAKIQAENSLRDAKKLQDILADLRARAKKSHIQWSTARESLKALRKQDKVDGRGLVIRQLESMIRANLAAFQFNPSAISSISISHQTLRPEQEGYDIVAETSASDYIRVIWAYTLALMELASKHEDVKHGGFVVFDEPRQHEASKISFSSLIDNASESMEYSGQVIFATSLDKSELEQVCENKQVNVIYFNDYILTQET